MRTRSFRRGYILMEIMLAVGIFAVAGVGLATALNEIAHSWLRARQFNSVRMEMESRLAEARLFPAAAAAKTMEQTPDGVEFHTAVRPLQVRDKNRLPLSGFYRITITARWHEGKNILEEESEAYAYQP